MGWGSIIGGALGSFIPGVGTTLGAGLGSLAEGASSYFSAKSAANQKHDWDMSADNTKYQRTVRDMLAAGLNPGLAYGGVGSAPASAMPETSRALNDAASNANSARSVTLAEKTQAAQIDMQRQLTEADVKLKNAQSAQAIKTAEATSQNIAINSPQALASMAAVSSAKGLTDALKKMGDEKAARDKGRKLSPDEPRVRPQDYY